MFADVAVWWLSAQLIGALALPLTVWFFRRLPERGYSFARPFGLLLTGYGAWLLSMLGLGAFSRGLLLLVGLLLLACGVMLLGRNGLRRAAEELRAQLPWLVLVEVLFALGLFAGVWMRWHDIFGRGVALNHTEQPMDLTLLSGILASRQFPPQDPWFAQYPINYYYLGYLLVAALIRLSGVAVGSGFTLGIATIWAFAATGTAGLIYNMMGLAQANQVEPRTRTENQASRRQAGGLGMSPRISRPRCRTRRWRTGRATGASLRNLKPARYLVPLLGVVLVLLIGNQAATLQILAGSEKVVAFGAREAVAAMLNGLGAREALPLPPGMPGDLAGGGTQLIPWPDGPNRGAIAWWSSRAVWDAIPQSNGEVVRAYAITEFPLFSFLLGDLHPHVLSLPWSLLALAVALNVLARRSAPELKARGGWVEVVLTGIALGGLYAINSWDLPTYLLIYLGALTLLYLRLAPSPRAFFWPHFLQQAGAVIAASYLLYLPFHMSFDAPTADPPIGFAATRTSLWHFLVMYGLFVVPLVAFVFREWSRTENQEPRTRQAAGRPGVWGCPPGFS